MPRKKGTPAPEESKHARAERRLGVSGTRDRAQPHMDESQRLRKEASDKLQAEHKRWRLRSKA